MGKVIEIRRPATKTKIRGVLETLLHKENEGVLYGCISISSTDEGSVLAIEGAYAERLQYAAYALLKALNEVTDKIAHLGTAGHSSVVSMRGVMPELPAQLPPGLRRRT